VTIESDSRGEGGALEETIRARQYSFRVL